MLYNNQQGCQAADENTKSAITTWRLLAYTCTLGIILGVTDADRTFNFLGILVCECCLEPLSLISALWLCLDCASTCPWFRLWCLGLQWSLSFVLHASLGLLGVPLLISLFLNEMMPVAESAMLPPRLDALDGLILSWMAQRKRLRKIQFHRWSASSGDLGWVVGILLTLWQSKDKV